MFGFGILTYLKIGIAVAAAAGIALFIWHYTGLKNERDLYLQEKASLEKTVSVQIATINAQEKNLEVWQAHVQKIQDDMEKLSQAQIEANQYSKDLNNVLSKHNLELLSIKKPGLIQNRINTGTGNVRRMLESETRFDDKSNKRPTPNGSR